MNALIIARRELREHRLGWAAALYVAAIGLGLPLLKDWSTLAKPETRLVVAVSMGFSFAWVMAALLGFTMIPRELEERRFSFYLARPLTPAAILSGKLLAALGLAIGGGLLVLVPHLLLHGWERWRGLPAMIGVLALGALFLFLLFHVLSVSIRSKTPWLLLDLASVSCFVWAVHRETLHLIQYGSLHLLGGFFLSLAMATLGILGAAAYLQVAKGGTDLRDGHRILSWVLAGGLAGVGLLGAGFVAWAM